MICVSTYLKVMDNSGAKEAQCIRILGGFHKKTATVGDMIVVAIKKCLPRKRVKKGDVRKGIVVSTRKRIRRPDGSYIWFEENGIALLNEQGSPLGTRILGPVAKELRQKNHIKFVSLASFVY
uniref:Ribosomal protein L14 n=1 Tax=Jakoba bahamiensis TaxID=221721 RepID=M4QL29_9EUKA|nr:ribosomal protein L14 [Jakoba bahamiensis]AGH24158.1 ribosomal protein L14 [Jakoba bahamiensis]